MCRGNFGFPSYGYLLNESSLICETCLSSVKQDRIVVSKKTLGPDVEFDQTVQAPPLNFPEPQVQANHYGYPSSRQSRSTCDSKDLEYDEVCCACNEIIAGEICYLHKEPTDAPFHLHCFHCHFCRKALQPGSVIQHDVNTLYCDGCATLATSGASLDRTSETRKDRGFGSGFDTHPNTQPRSSGHRRIPENFSSNSQVYCSGQAYFSGQTQTGPFSPFGSRTGPEFLPMSSQSLNTLPYRNNRGEALDIAHPFRL
jgi:hypothetical protein